MLEQIIQVNRPGKGRVAPIFALPVVLRQTELTSLGDVVMPTFVFDISTGGGGWGNYFRVAHQIFISIVSHSINY